MPDLSTQFDALSEETRSRLRQSGFDATWFLNEAGRLEEEDRRDNRVRGDVFPPGPGDVVDLPSQGSPEWIRLRDLGEEALAAGRCAFAVLAGGMATRMGGVVKALVDAVPGRTFLDMRLAEQEVISERVGRRVPLWLMTSYATDEPIRQALGDRLDGYWVATFPQHVSLRLDPEGDLYLGEDGEPSEHSPGHGDLPEVLAASGLLDDFLGRGGRYVTTANLDNLGATLDAAVVGAHIDSGTDLTCEVVDKEPGDRGGIPVRLDGRPVILEEFRVPATFDPSDVGVFNTNTFHFDAQALRDLDMPWTYFVVEKEVDGAKVIQFERLINEVASHLDAIFLRVPRQGAASRFLPVKDADQLAAKQDDIEAVARGRGMLP